MIIDNATFLSDKEAAIPDHDLEAAADMDEDLDCISNSQRYIHGYYIVRKMEEEASSDVYYISTMLC